MSAAKTERLINLVILLLSSQNFITKEQIRAALPPYQTTNVDAFEKMFERDKTELKRLGIPLETGYLDSLFADEVGYRIERKKYELPELNFSTAELDLLGLAGLVWENTERAAAAQRALRKLATFTDTSVELPELVTNPRTPDPDFTELWDACQQQLQVTFSYLGRKDETARLRRVRPYGLVTVDAIWYLVGCDAETGQERVFRLSRIQSPVQVTQTKFELPLGVDVRGIASVLIPPTKQQVARIRLKPGKGDRFRRRNLSKTPGEIVEVTYTDITQLAAEILEYLDTVEAVLAPPELATEVTSRIQKLLAKLAAP